MYYKVWRDFHSLIATLIYYTDENAVAIFYIHVTCTCNSNISRQCQEIKRVLRYFIINFNTALSENKLF